MALFAGAGGGILGGKLLGWSTVCAVEFNPYARRVLLARQRDGHLEPFPIWDDVRTFDGHPWRGAIDVISGGFPCQDISAAGKGVGIKGSRSGLWVQMARIVREVSPRFVFVENSPMLTSRGLGVVLGDLAALGYDARWGVLGAHHAGAPHKRDRVWILATHANNESAHANAREGGAIFAKRPIGRFYRSHECRCVSNANGSGQQKQRRPGPTTPQNALAKRCGWWKAESDLGCLADGVANRVDRLRALGNGQVPAVAALAWLTLGGPA